MVLQQPCLFHGKVEPNDVTQDGGVIRVMYCYLGNESKTRKVILL